MGPLATRAPQTEIINPVAEPGQAADASPPPFDATNGMEPNDARCAGACSDVLRDEHEIGPKEIGVSRHRLRCPGRRSCAVSSGHCPSTPLLTSRATESADRINACAWRRGRLSFVNHLRSRSLYMAPTNRNNPPSSRNARMKFVTLDSIDSVILDEMPDFLDYLFFHNIIDKLCWVAKLHYNDRETVKKRRHRLDVSFQKFVVQNKIGQPKARRCLSSSPDKNKLAFHLMKGWHNELVRSMPLHPDSLTIGTSLSRWDGPGSGGLAAWNIIQSYYAFFEFVCCLGTTINPSLDTRGHKKVSRFFNNQLVGAASGRILFYPFNVTSSHAGMSFPVHPEFCEYHYAAYPRERGKGIYDLEKELPLAYGVLNNDPVASVVDLMYELRLWANYTGVASLLKLSDGGYLRFLMKNLATIIYFFGGMGELAAIFAVGEAEYLGTLKRFSLDYIDRHEAFARNKYLIPPYIRLRSYKHLGLISSPIDFIIPESGDTVQFI